MENLVLPSSCVTPAGTSIEVQNEWEENTHTSRMGEKDESHLSSLKTILLLLWSETPRQIKKDCGFGVPGWRLV